MPSIKSAPSLVTLTLLACTDTSAPIFIDASALDYDLGFILRTNVQGTFLGASSIHWYEDGELLGEAPRQLALESEERALLVNMRFEDLAAASKAFSVARVPELSVELELDATACPDGRLIDASQAISVPLPAAAEVLEARAESEQLEPTDASAFPFLGQLRLRLPLGARGCVSLPNFAPLFGDPDLLSRELGTVAVIDLLRLDEDRLLVLTGASVTLIDRQAEPHVVARAPIPRLSGKVMRTKTRRPVARGVPIELVIAAQQVSEGVPETMFAVDLSYDGDRGIVLTRTSTLGPGNVSAAEVGPDGTAVVVGERAPIYVRAPGEPSFEAQTLAVGASFFSVVATPQGRFWVGGESGLLFEGDAASGDWSPVNVDDDFAVGMRVRALLPPVPGDDLWIAGSRGRVLERSSTGDWRGIELAMPSDYRRCARGAELSCGGMAQLNAVENLVRMPGRAGEPPTILAFVTECSAAIQLTSDDRCPGLMAFGETPIEGLENTRLFATDVLDERWITVGDEKPGSALYELDFGPL